MESKVNGKKMKSLYSLGQDLETEILLRLPVKSLLRFKCVDRSWNALFTTHTFITRNMHYHNKKRHMIFDHSSIPDPKDYRRSLYRESYIKQISDESEPKVEDVDESLCPSLPSFKWIKINPFYSYKGVFYIFISGIGVPHQFLLWNPATRESKVIPPPPPFDIYTTYSYRTLFSSFGGDPNTNDLKVVTLFLENNIIDHPEDWHRPLSAYVYNLSINSWTTHHDIVPVKAIDLLCLRLGPHRTTFGTIANGISYWLVGIANEKGFHSGATWILSFNFRNEQFRKLELPMQTNLVGSLAEINDSLAYVVHSRLTSSSAWDADVWILEQDSCWIKKYKFGSLDWPVPIFSIWKDGAEFLGPSEPIYRDEYNFPYHLYAYERDRALSLVSYDSNGQPRCPFEVTIGPPFEVVNGPSYDPSLFFVRKYVESMTPLSLF